MNQEFREFLINEVGITDESIDQVMAQFQECTEEWLLLSIIDLLPKSDARDFDQLIQINSPANVISQFLTSRIPNLEQHLQNRLEIFQQDIMEAIRSIRYTEKPVTPAAAVKEIEHDTKVKDPKEPKKEELSETKINKKIEKAVKKGDWATAANLISEKKKRRKDK